MYRCLTCVLLRCPAAEAARDSRTSRSGPISDALRPFGGEALPEEPTLYGAWGELHCGWDGMACTRVQYALNLSVFIPL